MPLFMDVHTIDGGVSVDDVAKAHMADLQTQGPYDVSYLRYWVDEARGKVFCLVDAPDPGAAVAVHREAHGLVADEIYLVHEGIDARRSRADGWYRCGLLPERVGVRDRRAHQKGRREGGGAVALLHCVTLPLP